MTFNEKFEELIDKGIESLEKGELEKAAVYNSFAQTIAMTGLLTNSKKTSTNKKESLKNSSSKKENDEIKEDKTENTKNIVQEENTNTEVDNTTQEESNKEPELVAEWTEEMIKLKQEVYDEYQLYLSSPEWKEYILASAIPAFFEGNQELISKGLDAITPLNIDGFMFYLKSLN